MSNKGNQPRHSKFLLISGSISSNTTFLSALTDLKMFSFSKVSWFFLVRNLSLSNARVEEEVVVLWALVFLTMMLRKGKTEKKPKKETQKKPRANCIRQS